MPSRPWTPKPGVWPESTDWAQVAAGHRWRRRWCALGAEVVRRGPTQWPVRITPLGPDRAAIGKPVELGVYRTLAQAQFHADIRAERRPNRRDPMSYDDEDAMPQVGRFRPVQA